jgi:hypothetical protein
MKQRRPWRRKRVFSAEEEGFLGCWRKMGLQTAKMNINKGNSMKWFNAIAVSQNVLPKLSNHALRRSGEDRAS